MVIKWATVRKKKEKSKPICKSFRKNRNDSEIPLLRAHCQSLSLLLPPCPLSSHLPLLLGFGQSLKNIVSSSCLNNHYKNIFFSITSVNKSYITEKIYNFIFQ